MKKKIVFSLLIGLSVLMGCEKEHIPGVISSRIGNIYKNTNGTEEILLHFEKKKIEVYTNGVRSYSLKYKNCDPPSYFFSGTPPVLSDSVLHYTKGYSFDHKGMGGHVLRVVYVWFSYVTPNSTVEFEDKIIVDFPGHTLESGHYFEPI